MSEKPQKRLVSKGRYAWLMAVRAMLVAAGLLFLCTGGVLLVTSQWHIDPRLQGGNSSDWPMGGAFLLMCLSAGPFFAALYFFNKERTIEEVAILTRETTRLLPLDKSLVRASDVPPSHQPAELLRSTQYGKETPAEELLRASTRDGQVS
jgi:hypothetical protein